MHRDIFRVSWTSCVCIRSALLLILIKSLLIVFIFLVRTGVIVRVIIFVSEIMVTWWRRSTCSVLGWFIFIIKLVILGFNFIRAFFIGTLLRFVARVTTNVTMLKMWRSPI